MDLGDHAAVGMLNHLAVLLHLDLAGGDDRPGDLGRDRPEAEAADQQHKRKPTEHQRTTQRKRAAHVTPPGPLARVISLAFFTMLFRISSRGP